MNDSMRTYKLGNTGTIISDFFKSLHLSLSKQLLSFLTVLFNVLVHIFASLSLICL